MIKCGSIVRITQGSDVGTNGIDGAQFERCGGGVDAADLKLALTKLTEGDKTRAKINSANPAGFEEPVSYLGSVSMKTPGPAL